MTSLTIPVLRRAIETRDGRTLAGFYTDHAVLRVIDHDSPPSKPRALRGREAITS